jgi:HEPN domain-containing protein
MTSRVLKELGVLTRGNPRLEFEKRVLRCLDMLEKREIIEKYRAKNKRVRLLRRTAEDSQAPLFV